MKNRKTKYLVLLLLCIISFSGCEKTDEPIATGTDRDKFIGNWAGNSNGPGGYRVFNMTITASNSAADQIILNNFDGVGVGNIIYATVNGNSLSFITTLVGQDRYDGTGALNNNTLSFSFTIDDGQTIENRTATATK
jgi:hypothetical protein